MTSVTGKRPRWTLWSVFAAFALLAVACGGGQTATSTAEDPSPSGEDLEGPLAFEEASSDAADAEMVPVKVAVPGTILGAPIWVAESQGFFADAGLDVDLVPVNDDGEAFNLLRSDDVQLASTSFYDVVLAQNKIDPDLVVTRELYGAGRLLEWNVGSGTLRIHVLPESTVDHPCDLEDATIGLPKSTSILLLATKRLMQNSGCDSEAVELRFFDPKDRLEALTDGSVEAAAFLEPWSNEAIRAGATRTFELDGALCTRCAVGVVASTRSWVMENSDVVARFDEAVARATALSRDQEAAFRAELVTCCALPIDEAAEIALPTWIEDQADLAVAVEDMLVVMRADGAGLGSLTAEDFLLDAS